MHDEWPSYTDDLRNLKPFYSVRQELSDEIMLRGSRWVYRLNSEILYLKNYRLHWSSGDQ